MTELKFVAETRSQGNSIIITIPVTIELLKNRKYQFSVETKQINGDDDET